jgi:acyl carrier protein
VSLANAARGHIGEVVDLRLAQLMIRSNALRFLWSVASEQISGNNFQEMHLVAAGSSTPMKSQSTQSKARPAAKLRSAAKRKVTGSTHSSDTLLGKLKQIASEVINKDISVDAPLMDAGLDSISTRELSNKISAHLNTELSPTLLFDHPTLRSIADALSADSGSAPAQEFEPEREAPVLPTVVVAHEATERAVSRTSGIAAQSVSSIIKSIQTTLLGIVGTTVAADAPLMSAGLDSISGTEFTNTLAKQFEIELPPTLLFDYPTIESMAGFIVETMPTVTLVEEAAEQSMPMNHLSVGVAETTASRLDARVFLASRRIRFALPGGCNDPTALKELGLRAWTANSHWPVSRLEAVELQGTSAAYGAFLAPDAFTADAAFFGISRTEARAMNPMEMLLLQTTYGALSDSSSDARAKLANAPIGFFLGTGGSAGGSAAGHASPSGAKKAPSVYSATSGALSVLSGRLSYTLGLTGPCQTTDTACSSSLVAAH